MSEVLKQLEAALLANKEKTDKVLTESANRAEKSDAEMAEIKAEIKALQEENSKLTAKLGETDTARKEYELKMNRIEASSAKREEMQTKSLGEKWVESDMWAEVKAKGGTVVRTDDLMLGDLYELKTLSNPATPDPTIPFYNPYNRGFIMPQMRDLIMRDLLNVVPTTSNNIEYEEESVFTNNAAVVAESGLKPQSNISFTSKNATIRTIAHWIPFTNQFLDDNPRMMSYVNNRMMRGLQEKEEYEMMYGTDTDTSLRGIFGAPGVQTYAWSEGDAGDTRMDAVLMAMLKVTNALYKADGLVINPNDYAKIKKAKNDNGDYLYPSLVTGENPRIWGLTPVESLSINEGEFLVGNFGMAAELYNRMSASMRITDGYMDFVVRNKKLLLVENRIQLVLLRPSAFVTAEWDEAPGS
jgi:HK97 family phage major capsid protein